MTHDTKHTKGPWIHSKHGFNILTADAMHSIAAVHPSHWSVKHPEEQLANARLIAASPDLYEACQAAFLLLSEYAPIWAVKVEDQLREALAKVRE